MKFEGNITGSQGNKNTKIIHCLFVNDLKVYAKNMHEMKVTLTYLQYSQRM